MGRRHDLEIRAERRGDLRHQCDTLFLAGANILQGMCLTTGAEQLVQRLFERPRDLLILLHGGIGHGGIRLDLAAGQGETEGVPEAQRKRPLRSEQVNDAGNGSCAVQQ